MGKLRIWTHCLSRINKRIAEISLPILKHNQYHPLARICDLASFVRMMDHDVFIRFLWSPTVNSEEPLFSSFCKPISANGIGAKEIGHLFHLIYMSILPTYNLPPFKPFTSTSQAKSGYSFAKVTLSSLAKGTSQAASLLLSIFTRRLYSCIDPQHLKYVKAQNKCVKKM